MIDYLNQLHEGIVEAYVGITQGLKTGEKSMFIFSIDGQLYTSLTGALN